jgi:hypothetical protein
LKKEHTPSEHSTFDDYFSSVCDDEDDGNLPSIDRVISDDKSLDSVSFTPKHRFNCYKENET